MLNVTPALVASRGIAERDLTGAVPYLAGAAQQAASVIRERFSPDAWRALTDLVELINSPLERECSESALIERVNGALRIIASFSGLAQENMSQLAGWRFLELGRRIERAIATCRFIRQFAFATDPMARSTCCWNSPTARSPTGCAMSWWRRARRWSISWRSIPTIRAPIVFQLARIETHLAALPKRGDENRLSPAEQIATVAAARMRTTEAAPSTTRRCSMSKRR